MLRIYRIFIRGNDKTEFRAIFLAMITYVFEFADNDLYLFIGQRPCPCIIVESFSEKEPAVVPDTPKAEYNT